MKDKEIRYLHIDTGLAAVNDDEMIIEGYALRFGEWSNPLKDSTGQDFLETITPEALKNADLSDVRCLINHDPNMVIGRTTSETLELRVDDVGLWFRCKLPQTSYARDIYENVRLGNVSQCSFGFHLADNGDEAVRDMQSGIVKRTVKAIASLFDVSVVTFPAYNASDVAVAKRSMDAANKAYNEERERFLLELDLEELEIK
ncbi:HK97 family phage prohead protease [Terribacillus sp. 7520-G]|uniref:HK97 family phage prohead protease n=1 Tax=Terribacillus sp. 7520-G TaxID=2025389 RepID=UPI000BA5024F|nr:HK97 family phage prohead protease [Terribacillus sp. 7520-G]PAD39810.1 hypothetical protein CHH53_04000 [Terribacillus sp. 7520-G]